MAERYRGNNQKLTNEDAEFLGLSRLNEVPTREEQAEIKANKMLADEVAKERDTVWKEEFGMTGAEAELSADEWLRNAGFDDLVKKELK